MNAIEKTYQPYNFSSTKCYVIVLRVKAYGYLKIEHKLPVEIKTLKGVFLSTTCKHIKNLHIGLISLNFNGQAFKSLQTAVPRTHQLHDCSQPLPFDEEIQPNSFLQGLYYDFTLSKVYPFEIRIYLHYIPRYQ